MTMRVTSDNRITGDLSAFPPTRLEQVATGFAGRWRADAISTSTADGTAIASFASSTSTGAFTGATGPVIRTEGGHRHLEFNGTTQSLSRVSSTNPVYVVMVVRIPDAITTRRELWSASDGASDRQSIAVDATGKFIVSNGTPLQGVSYTVGRWAVVGGLINADTGALSVSGGAEVSGSIGSNAPQATWRLGVKNSVYQRVDLRDVIVYNGANIPGPAGRLETIRALMREYTIT